MKKLLVAAGLFLFSPSAFAQTPVSKHVELRLNALNTLAGSATTGNPLPDCPNVALEHDTVTRLRDMFRGVDLSLREAELDILERSACMAYDIYIIEEEITRWMDDLIAYALACEESATATMITVLHGAVELLLDVRKGGLDPDHDRPGEPLSTATADEAREACPYTSDYAVPTFQDFFIDLSPQEGKGCQREVLPSSGPAGLQVLEEETDILDRIIQRFLSLAPTAPTVQKSFLVSAKEWRSAINALKNKIWDYLINSSPPHFLRAPRPPLGYPFPLLPAPVFPTYGDAKYTVGEAGCRGWPSDVTAPLGLTAPPVVRGEGFPLARRGFSPFAVSGGPFLTQMLARASTFLKEVIAESPNEYLIMLRREMGGSFLPTEVLSRDIIDLFPEHMRREAALELSVGGFQQAMQKASENLLRSGREFTRLSVTLPGDPPPGTSGYEPPLLRDVLRRFVTFTSQMCPNRGCTEPLERAFELSLREECFPFTLINQYGTGAHTIPRCGAKYVPP